jgi:excinuclease ABC subunit A
MSDEIRIRGARQHNLKGIDLSIPRRSVTVVTGPSGSGKSSLAFDTVYAEGQRRYIESLSTYAKQFLERMAKPAVDWIEGVSPSVAIDQKNAVKTSRSTVGTVTEVYDYLRLLWARVGQTFCPGCDVRVAPDTVQSAAASVLEWEPGTQVFVTFPFVLSSEITHTVAVTNIQAQGYLRVIADGDEVYLPDLEASGAQGTHDVAETEGHAAAEAESSNTVREQDLTTVDELLVVVDRIALDPEDRERLVDALAAALAEGGGHADVLRVEADAGLTRIVERRPFTEAFRCRQCGRDFPEPRPALFSFNSPAGACSKCTGFGATLEYDEDLIVPDPQRSLADGAVDPFAKPRYRRERAAVRELAEARGVSLHTPWAALPAPVHRELLHGGTSFIGAIPFLRSKERKRYKQYIRVFLRQYQRPRRCDLCDGKRLRDEALHVRVDGLDIAEASGLEVSRLLAWLDGLQLGAFERKMAASVLNELLDRLQFLDTVGLGYLTLDRQARSLSGGEMQRIRLASCLGSHLVDTLYVLDEPTIGLHARDVDRLVDVLWQLRGRGNTVLVVEHEPRVMERAEHIVELGPGAGQQGGEVVFEGSWEGLQGADTVTGRALSERPTLSFADSDARHRIEAGRGAWLHLKGASLHNVEDLDVAIPLGGLTVVTGVSGSGKSTLVHDILYRALESELHGRSTAKEHLGERAGSYDRLDGTEALDGVVLVDQSPIGRTPRSNPLTYIGGFGDVRRIFAEQPLAKSQGYGPSHFSFNRPGGRCEVCKGAGEELVEMVFLADVSVPCDACGGLRYRPEVLEVECRGLDIREVLELTVDQAIRFFLREDRLGKKLWQLQRVGLGYLRLGQPATTLSGGEAQRLKIARELARRRKAGRRLYILDEPTVGLGVSEIVLLRRVLDELVADGHSVLLVEHNLDLIATADWVIDLGPEAAEQGGRVVAAGPPAEIERTPGSHTGAYLRRHLGSEKVARAADA